MAATVVSLAGQSQAAAPAAVGPATCGDPGCTVTVDAKNLNSTPSDPNLDHLTFIVNDNNAKSPSDTLALNTQSHSPLVATGDQTDNHVTLPDGKYLISVQFTPQIPPPPCTGDEHVIDQSTLISRSNFYTGDQSTSPSKPLCDKHLVELGNGQNANAKTARDLIWRGNVLLLEHEQRALVQPNFDRLSCAFARIVSIGATMSFEVQGVRQEVAYFTSFYAYSLAHGMPNALAARSWPRITRYDDRWRWLEGNVVPRFRRLDADPHLIDAGLRRIFDEARVYASAPCVLPLTSAAAASTDPAH